MSTDRPTVAFLGLGAMGSRMVRRLLDADWPVAAFDVRPEAATVLAEHGARAASSPADAASAAEFVVVMVQNATQVRQALSGSDGALDAARPGTTVILMSTLAPGEAVALEPLVQARGAELLDCPVSGGTPGAESGTLSIMVGGPAERLERTRPLLERFGDRVYHVGPKIGDGQSAKMVNQLLAGVHLAAAAEALVLAAKAGLDTALMLEIVSHSAASSWMLQRRAPRMVGRQFDEVHSYLSIIAKDMGIVVDGAASLNAPTPLATSAREIYKAGLAMGLANRDDSAILQVFERLAGLTE